ncbi:putative polysaccharide biosynthesis protein [Pasteuria penetrans]|uniref:putative polysaccharide biosynthesis protein n=1 Tax=Pasteuria penetrans TaxID=86005 RepID=UPI000FB9259E|nr:polysaccharide biosynthesis protein [Pasteuria penetrans]
MARNFAHGATFLFITMLLTKILGFLFWFPFRIIADESVVGLYNLTYPTYSIVLTIATAGIPTTVSKLVSERLACADSWGARRIFRAAVFVLTFTSVPASIFLWVGSPWIARIISKQETYDSMEIEPSLRVLSIAVLLVPLMGALRGYFQGQRRMAPTGVSQFLEQLVRVVVMIVLVYWFTAAGYSKSMVSAGAMSGALAGGIVALLFMVFLYGREYRKQLIQEEKIGFENVPISRYRSRAREHGSILVLARQIMRYALPISLASLSLPLFQGVDSLTFLRLPESVHIFDNKVAMGIYSRGEPYVNIITILSVVLAMNIIPTLSRYLKRGEINKIRSRIRRLWLITVAISLPATTLMGMLAPSLTILMAGDSRGSMVLTLLAVSAIFGNLSLVSSSILQGLGYDKVPIRHLFVVIILKLLGNLTLVPLLGSIEGVAWATIVAYAVACGLNTGYLLREVNLTVDFRHIVLKPLFCTAIMATLLLPPMIWLENHLTSTSRFLHLGTIIIIGTMGVAIYTALAFSFRLITSQDIATLPFGRRALIWWRGK